jgi:plastocyanin
MNNSVTRRHRRAWIVVAALLLPALVFNPSQPPEAFASAQAPVQPPSSLRAPGAAVDSGVRTSSVQSRQVDIMGGRPLSLATANYRPLAPASRKSSNSPAATDTPTNTPVATATCQPTNRAVSMGDNFFNPSSLTVNVGTTVTWTNNGAVNHTTTSNTSLWNSGTMGPGATFSFAFNSTGTFAYHCNFHSGMTGTINVVPGCASTPTSTPSNSATSTRTNTPTNTPTVTPTSTRTNTATSTPSSTPTNTRTNTPTNTPTNTRTNTATNTPTNTPTVTPTNTPTNTPIGGTQFVGHLTWQGIGQPDARNQGLTATLTLCVGGTPQSQVVTTDQSGTFTTTTNLGPGIYNWRIKARKSLANSGSLSVPLTGTVEFGTQRAGDANDSNNTDATDFTTLKSTFGKSVGQPGYDERADFNNDTTVGSSDFTLLKSTFGQAGAASNCP